MCPLLFICRYKKQQGRWYVLLKLISDIYYLSVINILNLRITIMKSIIDHDTIHRYKVVGAIMLRSDGTMSNTDALKAIDDLFPYVSNIRIARIFFKISPLIMALRNIVQDVTLPEHILSEPLVRERCDYNRTTSVMIPYTSTRHRLSYPIDDLRLEATFIDTNLVRLFKPFEPGLVEPLVLPNGLVLPEEVYRVFSDKITEYTISNGGMCYVTEPVCSNTTLFTGLIPYQETTYIVINLSIAKRVYHVN